jgi:Tol biopolymer transport system component
MRGTFRLVVVTGVALCCLMAGTAGGAFPGANGRVVFVTNRDGGTQELYSANPDGSNPVRLTTNPSPETSPAVSPDGTRIVFARDNDIWVMGAGGGGEVAITGIEGPDSDPAWSPDGTQIVYVSNHSTAGGGTTGPELFVKNADGSGTARQVTDTPIGASRAPAWSPAGDQIAYESNADGGFEVYTIAASATQGFGVRRTANEVGQNYQNPSWSPDGTRIAFERGIGTNVGDTTKELWTMAADGSDVVRITNNTVYDADPAYSPDCTLIAFETVRSGNREIFTRPAVQAGAETNITNTSQNVADWEPDWAAVPGTGPACGSAPPPRGRVTLADLDDPTLGVDVNVDVVSGTVLVGTPGLPARASARGRASQKGVDFAPLTEARQIPVGSFIDTRKGRVALQSAKDRAGTRQTGKFLDGLFQVRQSKKRKAKGLTDLVLKGSSFRRCGRAGRSKTASASLSRRRIRRLRADARGRFRTSGQNSSATVRGTKWTMEDRCDGTLTAVQRGRVVVRDFRLRRNITVRAGKRYLAKARR